MSHGNRTIPETIDRLALSHSDKVWARYPLSPEAFEQGEWHSVTFHQLANAIHRLAWRLSELFSEHADLETICYVGPSDIRYFILACAASKCRLKCLFSSPRNQVDAHLSLLEKTGCRMLFGSRDQTQDETLRRLVDAQNVKYEILPSLDELLDHQIVEPFPWSYSFEDVATEPFLVLHTSGSTGLPKPVSISHGLLATIDLQQTLPDVNGRSVSAPAWANRPVYTALPPFHSAGINFFCYSIFQFTELIFGPCDKPPSMETVDRILDAHIADAAVMAPSLLAEVAMDHVMLSKISQWSSVTFGGGPLPKEAGDALWEKTKVLQILGSTETFNIPELMPRSIDEWEYHNYHPCLGIEYRLQEGSNGLAELVFVRNTASQRHQGAFWTFPDFQEYPMKDLYEQHPSNADCWRYRGRLDDIIVLSNGEKINPTAAERLIAREETVQSALIVGASREQPALLVEPADIPGLELEKRRASIVQAVEYANEILPAHAQIHESHIRVLEPSESFLRSAKGEIRRAPTTDALCDLITQVYDSADGGSVHSPQLDFSSVESLSHCLRDFLSVEFMGRREIALDANIFKLGFDSLKALKLLRYLNQSLREQGHDSKLAPRAIYQHPTALKMARMMLQTLQGKPCEESDADDHLAAMQRMHDLFDKRICDFKQDLRAKVLSRRHVFVLTGSSGSLGSYVLDSLLLSPFVDKVVCLNRPGSNAEKQAKINESRGLTTDLSRVTFFETDISRPHLGLVDQQYNELLQEASHVIHNAYPVNFNLPLSSFEPQLETCCHMIELATTSRNKVKTMFLSSVGAANQWASVHDGSVPEEVLSDFRISEDMGYAQSKQLGELLFARASQKHDLHVTICRVGQIAGPVKSDKGLWNPSEWFPSIMSSCDALGTIPESLEAMDCMDWIPVDMLGNMLVEAALADTTATPSEPDASTPDTHTPGALSETSSASEGSSLELGVASSQTSLSSASEETMPNMEATVLHFVNPNKTYWRDIVHSLVKADNGRIQVVPYSEWLNTLAEASEREDSAERVPAVKLVSFFRDIGQPGSKRPVFSTDIAQEKSVSLSKLEPVSLGWVQRWLRQWEIVL
ncbi:acetyl- synthetase [Lecanosticta acicola]|uniref:Acetyl- synthetase n=1 Tax=Lecanosticta acicola TaxID=111012 RepID=A0AAI8YZL2_9PEZI|nr:acetyl- synthetase [Lecanosticta acicola]